MTREVLFVPDLAAMLGLTEASIRSHLQRKSDALPPSFRMGRRVAWRASTVSKWLDRKDAASAKLLR